MPLTASHPAAVLPLRRLGLPMTALVTGSMVPDTPLFLGWHRGYQLTHSLVGVITVDVVVTVLVLTLWFGLVRDVLVDLSSDAVRARLVPHVRLGRRQWQLTPAAAILGALTHVLWDTFTHPDRWGSDRIGWLHAEHAGLLGSAWAQYVSGVLGLLVVCSATYTHLRSLPPLRSPPPRSPWASGTVAAIVLVGVVAGLAAAVSAAPGLHAMAFDAVVDGIVAVAVSIVAVCAAWRLLGPSPG